MDHHKYKQKLKDLKEADSIPLFREDLDCIIDSRLLLDELFKTMLNYPQDYGIKWMKGLRQYLDDKKKCPQRFNSHLKRGHIIEIELFGHFNKEMSFLHPAVGLYDSHKSWMLVAPISSPKYGSDDPLHIKVDINDGLKHPSAICLDDIRVIDKKRVWYQHRKNGQNAKVRASKLDEVDEVILRIFMPVMDSKYKEVQKKLDEERQEHEKTKEKLKFLEEQLAQPEIAVTKELDKG